MNEIETVQLPLQRVERTEQVYLNGVYMTLKVASLEIDMRLLAQNVLPLLEKPLVDAVLRAQQDLFDRIEAKRVQLAEEEKAREKMLDARVARVRDLSPELTQQLRDVLAAAESMERVGAEKVNVKNVQEIPF